jgi:hypothetical protein
VISLVVAVRKSSGRTLSDVDATYSQYGIDLDTGVSYKIDGVEVPDWDTVTERETRWHRGSKHFSYTPHEGRHIRRNAATGGLDLGGMLSIRVDEGLCDVSADGLFKILAYEVTPTNPQGFGAFRFGGIAPDLSFGFGVPDPSDAYKPFGLFLYVRIGPNQTPPQGP